MGFENVGHGNIGKRRKVFNGLVRDKLIQDYEVIEEKVIGSSDGESIGAVNNTTPVAPAVKISEVAYTVVDVANEIPMLSLSQEERKVWYCDGLHLTKKGYNLVGEMVFEEICKQGWNK